MTLPIVERLRTCRFDAFDDYLLLGQAADEIENQQDKIKELVEVLQFASALLRANRENVAADDCDKVLAKIGGAA